jgi:hypothetical protein
VRLPGTICTWYEKTSRVRASTLTLTDPLHIVVPVGRIVAERFDTREVLEPATLRILKGPVDPEVVGVPVHVRHRLPEPSDLFAESDEKLLKAVRHRIRLCQRAWVANGRASRIRHIPPRIRL